MSEYIGKTVWPGWKTIRVIGRGGFGEVYEVERDIAGLEKAAVKRVSIPQNNGEIEELYANGYDDISLKRHFNGYLQEILKEYRMMVELKGSANIVICDDVRYEQRADGIGWDIYIRMELLTPLLKVLNQVDTEEQIIKLGCDICNALVLCKSQNIVHRDIKPQNIFVSKNGNYKLGDFGIAKTMEKTSGATKIGTYEYMAPEVYRGQPYGSTADIYSLGMVLYWLLNERRSPFNALPPQIPTSMEREKARERRFSGEQIPNPAHGSEELKRIVLKACAFAPRERYASAKEMLDDLEGLVGDRKSSTEKRVSLRANDSDRTEKIQLAGKKRNVIQAETDTKGIFEESIISVNRTEDFKTRREISFGNKPNKNDNKIRSENNKKDYSNNLNARDGHENKLPSKKKTIKGWVWILLAIVLGLVLLIALCIVFMNRNGGALQETDSKNDTKEAAASEPIDETAAESAEDDTEEKEDAGQITADTSLPTEKPTETPDPNEQIILQLSNASVGDYVFLGEYEQDNNPENGKEKVDWIVLAKEDSGILLISKYALDCKPYNTSYKEVTWETCSIREWLNESFLNNTFNSYELRLIQSTNVSADKNPVYDLSPGKTTTDKVFLLSIDEVNKYYQSGEAKCAATDYAIAQGASTSVGHSVDGRAACRWWLRTPGGSLAYAALIAFEGAPIYYGTEVNYTYGAVRPAVWVNLEPDQQNNAEEAAAENEEPAVDAVPTDNATVNSNSNAIGRVIKFGTYKQNSSTSNKRKEIEWIVLAQEEGRVLIISKHALDCQRYNTAFKSITWETCSLRKWLNGTFFNSAFNNDEKKKILTTTVTADENPYYDTSSGKDTKDKVFLLSIAEANKYFGSYEERKCTLTNYAKDQGAWTSENYTKDGVPTCWWWLRSPGRKSNYAAFVDDEGTVYDGGNSIYNANYAVRPALWITWDE